MKKIADFSIHYIDDVPYNIQICGVTIENNKFVFRNIISRKEINLDKKDLEDFKRYIRLSDTIPNTIIILSEVAAFDANKVLSTKVIPSEVLIRTCKVRNDIIDENTFALVDNLDNNNLIWLGDNITDLECDEIDNIVFDHTTGRLNEQYYTGSKYIVVMGMATSGKLVNNVNNTSEIYLVEDNDLEHNTDEENTLYKCFTIQSKFKVFRHMRIACQFIIKNILSQCK